MSDANHAKVYDYDNGERFGAHCNTCEWTNSTTSTSRQMAQRDADKHNDEKHGLPAEGHWYTR